MEIAILAVLSMAAGSLITGGFVVLATRPRREPAGLTEPRDASPAAAASSEAAPEDGKPTIDDQFNAIFGYERKGGLKVE
jgi:hypothetical protein